MIRQKESKPNKSTSSKKKRKKKPEFSEDEEEDEEDEKDEEDDFKVNKRSVVSVNDQLEIHKAKKSLLSNKIPELKEMLRKNQQKVTGTKPELVDRVAEGMVLGAIPQCNSCGGGRLRFDGSGYTCPGKYVFSFFDSNCFLQVF